MEEKVIPILRIRDHVTAVAWYNRLGFHQTAIHRFEPGLPAFVTVERGPMQLFLSEAQRRLSPRHAHLPQRRRHSPDCHGIQRAGSAATVGAGGRDS